MSKRRLRRQKSKSESGVKKQTSSKKPTAEKVKDAVVVEKFKNPVVQYFNRNYKVLMLIPIIMLFLAMAQIGYQGFSTGDFINKGVGLKGGVVITVPPGDYNLDQLKSDLDAEYAEYDVTVRTLAGSSGKNGLIIEASVTEDDMRIAFSHKVADAVGLTVDDMNIDVMGASLGAAFFDQTYRAMIVAFWLMGMVVFLYFAKDFVAKILVVIFTICNVFFIYMGSSMGFTLLALMSSIGLLGIYARYNVPSLAVMISAFSDIVITIAIVNILGIKISTAGIAAFLMLIGYSIDTDILLTTRVLKHGQGSIFRRILSAAKTGLTMNISTLAALLVGILISQSEVLSQIMTIMFIGLVVDIVVTWIFNAGILRYYLERKGLE